MAIALQLLSGLPYRWLLLLAVVGLAIVIWVTSFEWIERVFGYGGLCMLVFAVAAVKLGPDWSSVGKRLHPPPPRDRQAAVPLLRRRAPRRRDDPVRGLLLLVRRRRGRVVAEGSRPEPRERDHRVRARRVPLDRADDGRRRALPAAGHPARASRDDRARLRRAARPGRAPPRSRRDPVRGRRRLDRHRVLWRLQPRAVLRLGVGPLPASERGAPLRADLGRPARPAGSRSR